MTRWTRSWLVVSWLVLGASAGCEDDPLDLDYLKDSGTDAALPGSDASAADSGGLDASAADSGSSDGGTDDASAEDAGQ